jgi:superfamily I DNA/RNA helicase
MYTAFKTLVNHYDQDTGIEQFSSDVARYMAPWRKVEDFLSEASSWVDFFSTSSASSQGSSVRLMTFQGAKGLEAKVVCVIGLEEGVIPRRTDDTDLAEAGRLLFVSMTRAINELHLFHARKRSGNGILALLGRTYQGTLRKPVSPGSLSENVARKCQPLFGALIVRKPCFPIRSVL